MSLDPILVVSHSHVTPPAYDTCPMDSKVLSQLLEQLQPGTHDAMLTKTPCLILTKSPHRISFHGSYRLTLDPKLVGYLSQGIPPAYDTCPIDSQILSQLLE